MWQRRRVLVAVVLAFTAACSKAPVVEIEVTTGQEKGSFSAEPKVVRIDIEAKTVDNKITLKASAAPGGSFDLGQVPDTQPLSFTLTGFGADGKTVVARGRSVNVPVGSITSGKVSLFMQRVGAGCPTEPCSFARPNGGLVSAHVRGQAAVFQERLLLLTGGDSAADETGPQNTQLADFYDLLAGAGAQSGATLPRNAGAIVIRNSSVLVVDKDGATWVNLSSTAKSEVAAPEGLSFADVVGGQAIDTPSGATWIVGATRDNDPPTKAILVVGADSTLSSRSLVTARAGAAAAWIGGVGLVVSGGSADGLGVEEVPDTGAATALPYPPDATKGAAIASYANGQVAVMGGALSGAPMPTRLLDLGCAPNCAAALVGPDATIATLSARSQAFIVTGAFLVVGDDPNGQTRCFRVDIGNVSATELPLREPRLGASVVAAPNGTLAILGGTLVSGGPALSMESYFPE